ncbi:MAG: N-acetylglucosamine-6-phosphate deacetylase [Clostridia bacterium]|nr:N-acetylglucosamine-6-phosphate deacetylase [Clostridia bacterium]
MITKITNGILITDTLESGKNLYIDGNRICAITEANLPADTVIDANGLYVSPGFIDIHTHGAGGFDVADGTAEDILRAAHEHARHGTTSMYPSCTSTSAEAIEAFIENVKTAMAQNAPGKPHIAGSHLEGPYFSDVMRGAQNPTCLKTPDPAEYEKWIRLGEGTVRRISFAPELPGAEQLCEYLTENGVVAAFGHTDAVYGELKPLIDKGCRLATHLYSGMNTVVRRDLMRHLGAVETSFLEDSVDVEIIADGIHLPPELLKLIYKIKGADRICLVTDSMRGAGMGEGTFVLGPKDDAVECISKNGIAYLPDMTAFAGSVATADRLVRVMHKQADVSLIKCIKMMCATPARVMHLPERGELKVGYYADIVLFDGDIMIQKVLIEGKELQ